jgi:hypothetical protein
MERTLMSTYKISDLPQNTAGVEGNDLVIIVDVSENVTQSSTVDELVGSLSGTVTAPNYQEGVSENTSTSGTVTLDPSLGSIQIFTVVSTTTFSLTADFESGESMTMHIKNTSSSPISWDAGIIWVGGSAPTLNDSNGTYFVSVWKAGTEYFGSYAGRAY